MARLSIAGMLLLAAALVRPEPDARATDSFARASDSFIDKPGTFRFLGAGSCAGTSCHNGTTGTGPQGQEYRIALARDFTAPTPNCYDKHAQAYEVLWDERSKQIVKNLHGLRSLAEAQPEREALCLRCHVHPAYDALPTRVVQGVRQFRLEDGVSCETCHGPAEGWLAAHFRPGFDEAARLRLGMRDTRSIAGRAELCVDCHVGSAAADVNHDLIAAGHPWLHFDFSDHHRRLHKHWERAKDTDPRLDPRGRADFEAAAWVVGQAVSARAALLLVAERARDERRPWPEFAENDCLACHRGLTGAAPSALKERGRSGQAEPNAWYTALLGEALATAGRDAQLDAALADLRSALRSWSPSRGLVADKARLAADRLERWLEQWRREQPAVAVASAARRVLDSPTAQNAERWDRALPLRHALTALEQTRRAQHLPVAPWSRTAAALDKLFDLPSGCDVQRHFDPAAVKKALEYAR